MRALQHYLPIPRHIETIRIFVQAKPEQAWETARHFDMSTIPWVRFMFDVRTTFFDKKDSEATGNGLGIDQIGKSGGFIILYEQPGKEVVIGSIGQFWHLNIPFSTITPEDFTSFSTAGWGKVAWAISVEPYLDGSTISVELRISATDEDSWRKLFTYYQLIGIGSKLIRQSVMNHLEVVLGKLRFPDEDTIPLPGDDIIPDARYKATHAINIEAPVSIVWHYLMQLGCDRAGWYSIDWLDHGGVPSVNHLVENWATRQIGDRLAATPKQDSFFEVYQVEEQKYFVIGGEAEKMGFVHPYKMSWAFVVEPIGGDATRLITRARMEAFPKWAEWMMGNIIYPPIHGLMSQVQLKTLKSYSERDALMRKSQPASK
jgi:hypothetical protein